MLWHNISEFCIKTIMSDQTRNDNSISINANSSANAGNNDIDENGVSLGKSNLQTPKEVAKGKKQDNAPEGDSNINSGVDNLQSNDDSAAGTARAGTAERKPFGDGELNKGLEAQARDEEAV